MITERARISGEFYYRNLPPKCNFAPVMSFPDSLKIRIHTPELLNGGRNQNGNKDHNRYELRSIGPESK